MIVTAMLAPIDRRPATTIAVSAIRHHPRRRADEMLGVITTVCVLSIAYRRRAVRTYIHADFSTDDLMAVSDKSS